ncbi:MAG: hypothetical protein HGA19_07905 [Oscillochloris sp.]|nr:hypothetical protein [Oscillochloris sp.]
MSINSIARWKRLIIAMGIVLAGMALIPYIALPSERFGWQLFTGAYSDGPGLSISYDTGAPGSSFVVTGFNYPANQSLLISVNEIPLGTITTDEIGGFSIVITSVADNGEGYYIIKIEGETTEGSSVSASTSSASSRFKLDSAAPLRTVENPSIVFNMTSAIEPVSLLYIPIIFR